jgi:hypothetical protein
MSLSDLSTLYLIHKSFMRSAPSPSVDDERARLAQERHKLEKERAAFEAERDERLEQQRTGRRRAEAIAIAADLGHDMDVNRPGYVASLIIAAGRKARGELPEQPRLTGLAAEIVRQGKIRRGEAVADAVVLPENPMARAVILLGKRARGETTADEESWLNNFLKKVER